jgi:hypothetical protein
MRKWILLMPAMLTLGCTVELTKDGSSVRSVNDTSNCQFLGTVTGFHQGGGSIPRNTEGAMNDLRNKAAQMGANALKINDVDTTPQGTTTLGDALICRFE